MMPVSLHDLKRRIVRLRAEIDRERGERNYFQVERDTIHTISDNTQRELQEKKDELKNLEKDIGEDKRSHQVQINVFKQKMKYLLCEHQNTTSESRENALVSTKTQKKEQHKFESELHHRVKAIKVEIEEINDDCLVKELELKHAEEVTTLGDKLEKQLTETEAMYEEKMKSLIQELENMKTNEFSEREDQWNSHSDALISDHNKALSEARELGKNIKEVVDENNILKAQIKEMKTKQKQKKKDLTSVLSDNKCLAEHLSKATEEITEKMTKMKHSGMEKDTNEKITAKKMNDLKQDQDTLKERFNQLQLERDKLYKTRSSQKAWLEADAKNLQLEKKLKALTDSLEKTNAQLHSVLAASNMDQTALCEVINNIAENLDSLNNTTKILQLKKNQISKAHEGLLLCYKAKLRALGVPVEEFCAGRSRE